MFDSLKSTDDVTKMNEHLNVTTFVHALTHT